MNIKGRKKIEVLSCGGGRMTERQAKAEYDKIMAELAQKEDEIMKEAKEKGTWKTGLDSNNELFADLKAEMWKKIEAVIVMIDE